MKTKKVAKKTVSKKLPKKMQKEFSGYKFLLGKKVLVRSEVAGVHCGTLRAISGTTVILEGSYRLWRFYTKHKDMTGSVSAVCAFGLYASQPDMIGPQMPMTLIENPRGLEVDLMTDAAFESVARKAPK